MRVNCVLASPRITQADPSQRTPTRGGSITLLLIVVVLTSVVGKLVLIRWWQSRLQGVNSFNDSSNGEFHLLKSCVDGLLVIRE
jgi:hypothetical protein